MRAPAATGRASFTTLSEAAPGSPKVFSGTRLDLHAIAGNSAELGQFKVAPLSHPQVDLPFGVLLDTIMFPLTSSSATYEFIFE